MNKTATIRVLTAVAAGITNGMSKRADSVLKPSMFQSAVPAWQGHTKGNNQGFTLPRQTIAQSAVPAWQGHTKGNNQGFTNRLRGAVGTAARSIPIIGSLIDIPWRIGRTMYGPKKPVGAANQNVGKSLF